MSPDPAPAAAPPPAAPSRAGTWLLGCLGASWVGAFSPTPSALWAVPGVVGLLGVVERARRARLAVLWIVFFAAVAIGAGYRWLAPTVRVFGELDERLGIAAAPVSWLVLGAYAVAATIHLGLFAALYRFLLRGPRRPHPLTTALLLVACESLPIRFLPWMIGHGAVETAPLRQLAEWGGLPLVSFALLALVVPVHELLRWVAPREGALPARPVAALASFLVGVALYGAGWWRLSAVVAEDAAATARVRVGIVQANVGSLAKRDAERARGDLPRRNREAYARGTRRAAEAGAELVVWPETALVEGLRVWDAAAGRPRPRSAVDNHLAALGYGFLPEVGRDRALLLGGYADEAGADGATRRFNVAMLRESGGADWSIYRKVRLMPFGETMPGSSLVPALADLLPQSFRMSPGDPDQPPIVWRGRGLSICAFICYESILPDLVARLAGGARPDLLVNLTNDSWYGDTWEPHQHLNFSRFRAVEHRAPMLRATNTGISAIVTAAGEVSHRLAYEAEGEIVADVPLVARPRTLYARIAPWLRESIWGAALLVLALAAARRRRAPRAI